MIHKIALNARLRDLLLAVITLIANLALTPVTFDIEPLLGHASVSATLTIVVAILGVVPLCWRTGSPLIVFGAVWLLALPVLLFIGNYRPILVLLVAMFAAARSAKPWQSVVVLIATIVAFVLVMAAEAGASDLITNPAALLVGTTVYLALVLAVWGGGRWVAKSHLRLLDIERRRDIEARQAVAAERSRIARELHDIVAHSISMITIQAAGAHQVLRADPARAETALISIDYLGRQAVDELRRLLGVLRSEAPSLLAGPEGQFAGSENQPTLSNASEVLANMTGAGLTLSTQVVGQPGRLDPSVDSTAFRVLQEALTNVLKHVGPKATASVVTTWTPDRLILEITSTAPTSPLPGNSVGGHGLLGLRERAVAVGGELVVGRLPDERFRVTASLPRPRDKSKIS